jgi:hypothetical protein
MEKLRKFPKISEGTPQRRLYTFGPFQVDPVKRLLLRGAEPIPLQVVGAPFAESTVLVLAHTYEQKTEWHKRRPKPNPG